MGLPGWGRRGGDHRTPVVRAMSNPACAAPARPAWSRVDSHPLTQPFAAPAPRRGPGSFILILLGVGAIGILVWPVFPGLTLAAVLATLVMPLHRRLLVRLPRR